MQGSSALSLWPKLPSLERLVLRSKSVSFHDVSCIASKTSNLRNFVLNVRFAIESGEMFKPLVESNKFLRYVSVR